jgi:steroid delta-isomerase-like uncharacterized protein
MPADQPDSLIRGLIDIAFNLGNFSAIEELFAPESITHIPAWGMPNNRLGLKQLIAGFRTAFPDLHCTVEDEIYTEDKVAAHWTLRGTHQGLFFGNQPTGRPVVVQGIIFARIEHGRIAENWTLVDQIGMLQQLGIVPPPKDG